MLGGAGDVGRKLEEAVEGARGDFAAGRMREALDRLHAAVALAGGHGMHREAAQLKRAVGILGNGGRPKLLTKAGARLGDWEER